MSQNYTDDCFKGTHVAQTDMQNIENNFACLKSGFSGSSAPSNPVAGMPWFDIDVDQQYVRNKDNDQWLSLDFIPGTIVMFGQASAPLGWTKVTTWTDNSMLCINSQADGTALGAGGSDNPQIAHTHTTPSHTHTITFTTKNVEKAGTFTEQVVNSMSSPTGASGGTSGANTLPLYHEVIACSKD